MKKLVLTRIGRDSWSRPVYEDSEGRLFVDVEPRSHRPPEICTKYRNAFDGEPDTPISVMDAYKDVDVEFVPCRDTW